MQDRWTFASRFPILLLLAAIVGLLGLYPHLAAAFRVGAVAEPEPAAPSSWPVIYGYVANLAEGTVSVLDVRAQAEIGRINVGPGPYKVALTYDEQWALVTNSYTNTLSFIDTATNSQVAQIQVGALPRGLAIDGRGLAYVANTGEASASVVDVNAQSVVTTVQDFPTNIWDVAVAPEGQFAYFTAEGHSGTIYRLDTASWTVETWIDIPEGNGCGAGIAMSPSGATLYVADPCDPPKVRAIDVATGDYQEHVLLEGGGAWEVEWAPQGGLAFISNEFLPPPGIGENSISVLETAGHSEILVVPVAEAPVGLEALGSGRYLYVTNWGSDTVSVVDTEWGEVTSSISVGEQPWGIALMGARLSLAKTAYRAEAPLGWANHYKIVVRNNTLEPIQNIQVYDLLPDDLEFLGTMGTGGSYDGETVHWMIERLEPGQEATLRVRFRPGSGLQVGQTIHNEAYAMGAGQLAGYDWAEITLVEPPVPTATDTIVPTLTQSPSPLPSATMTGTWTPTQTQSPTPASTVTASPTPTLTSTPTSESTPEPARIQIYTWHDWDGNGLADGQEPPLADVVASVSHLEHQFVGVTDEQGEATFEGLMPGSWLARTEPLSGYEQTTAHAIKVDLAAGESISVTFGFRRPALQLPLILTTEE